MDAERESSLPYGLLRVHFVLVTKVLVGQERLVVDEGLDLMLRKA